MKFKLALLLLLSLMLGVSCQLSPSPSPTQSTVTESLAQGTSTESPTQGEQLFLFGSNINKIGFYAVPYKLLGAQQRQPNSWFSIIIKMPISNYCAGAASSLLHTQRMAQIPMHNSFQHCVGCSLKVLCMFLLKAQVSARVGHMTETQSEEHIEAYSVTMEQ